MFEFLMVYAHDNLFSGNALSALIGASASHVVSWFHTRRQRKTLAAGLVYELVEIGQAVAVRVNAFNNPSEDWPDFSRVWSMPPRSGMFEAVASQVGQLGPVAAPAVVRLYAALAAAHRSEDEALKLGWPCQDALNHGDPNADYIDGMHRHKRTAWKAVASAASSAIASVVAVMGHAPTGFTKDQITTLVDNLQQLSAGEYLDDPLAKKVPAIALSGASDLKFETEPSF
jgi:hypothetical protein